MIYTLTLNPSLDYIVEVEDFELGKTNRTSSEKLIFGGKGINVSKVLGNLGVDNIALGFAAGFTGEVLLEKMKEAGIKSDFIVLNDGMTRINVKLKNYDGTEINAAGPVIDEAAIEQLYNMLDELLEDKDILVLAGSIPKGVTASLYADIMEHFTERNIRFVVDTTGNSLFECLKYKPFLIKPNHHELGELFGVELSDKKEIALYAKKLHTMGALNVLISMSKDGALLVDVAGAVHEVNAPSGKVINAVGAGDSMVAGFITGYMKNNTYSEAVRYGVAAGSASAFSEKLATREEIMELIKEL